MNGMVPVMARPGPTGKPHRAAQRQWFFLRQRLFTLLSFLLLDNMSSGRMRAAQAYIIVDSKSGYILQEHDSKAKRQVGSLTKIAMAMVVAVMG